MQLWNESIWRRVRGLGHIEAICLIMKSIYSLLIVHLLSVINPRLPTSHHVCLAHEILSKRRRWSDSHSLKWHTLCLQNSFFIDGASWSTNINLLLLLLLLCLILLKYLRIQSLWNKIYILNL